MAPPQKGKIKSGVSSSKGEKKYGGAGMKEIIESIDEENALGRGAFSEVFQIPDKHIAVKRISKPHHGQYKSEIEVLQSIKPNKNIIGLLGSHADDDYFYIFLECCPISLKSKIQGNLAT